MKGIKGEGNGIFESMIESVNKYLEKNSGSAIDFGIIKDTVDRHCDSVENDIATQIPIPLYCGLAGTMFGVIVGLRDLLESGAISTLLGSSGELINGVSSENAASGITSLLEGVAWAMLTSIWGIILTTANSLIFKRCSLEEEEGKNSFLAWIQSELLPELPSNTSQVFNQLVRNLNRFNDRFAQNTSDLGRALDEVNGMYAIQADVIKAVHDMDIMNIAQANIRVLQQLQQCTDKLALFNQYLDRVEGYTAAIHRFETLFNEEAGRIHVLEEIRDFFGRHRAEIARTTADADNAIREALSRINESTSAGINELHARLIEQSEALREIVKTENESFGQFISDLTSRFSTQMEQIKEITSANVEEFHSRFAEQEKEFGRFLEAEKQEYERFSAEMRASFVEQMDKIPQLAEQLEGIAALPAQFDRLIQSVDDLNARLADGQSQSGREYVVQDNGNEPHSGATESKPVPMWVRMSGWTAVVIIAITCIANLILNLASVYDGNGKTNASEVTGQSVSVSETARTGAVVMQDSVIVEDSVNSHKKTQP